LLKVETKDSKLIPYRQEGGGRQSIRDGEKKMTQIGTHKKHRQKKRNEKKRGKEREATCKAERDPRILGPKMKSQKYVKGTRDGQNYENIQGVKRQPVSQST